VVGHVLILGVVGVATLRLCRVGEIDAEDDTIERFVVRHYRYDPQRSERRHVVVASYDNELEFEARIQLENRELERRRASGEEVDAREYISGITLEPGYSRRAANGHLIKRAFGHGVSAGPWLDAFELPSNMWLMRSPDPDVGAQPSAVDR
jgi:hypothetical protein